MPHHRGDPVAAGPEQDGGAAADEDGRDPGVGAEIGAGAVGPGLEQQPLRGDGGDDGDTSDSEECARRPAGQLPHDHRHHGPQDVELLLDGEAPRVVQRRRRAERLPVGSRSAELPPVGDVDGRGHHGPAQAEAGAALDQPRGHEDQDGQQQPQRRQQAAGTAAPERGQAEPAAAEVVEDQPGDEEARHREEEVDAQVTTVEVTGVEGDDGKDRQPAQPVQRRHPRHARRQRRRRRERCRHGATCAFVL